MIHLFICLLNKAICKKCSKIYSRTARTRHW